ncbi:hypothetical protein T439DRAFT_324525 [Meredithblackwellia eburnea MCA 4105]
MEALPYELLERCLSFTRGPIPLLMGHRESHTFSSNLIRASLVNRRWRDAAQAILFTMVVIPHSTSEHNFARAWIDSEPRLESKYIVRELWVPRVGNKVLEDVIAACPRLRTLTLPMEMDSQSWSILRKLPELERLELHFPESFVNPAEDLTSPLPFRLKHLFLWIGNIVPPLALINHVFSCSEGTMSSLRLAFTAPSATWCLDAVFPIVASGLRHLFLDSPYGTDFYPLLRYCSSLSSLSLVAKEEVKEGQADYVTCLALIATALPKRGTIVRLSLYTSFRQFSATFSESGREFRQELLDALSQPCFSSLRQIHLPHVNLTRFSKHRTIREALPGSAFANFMNMCTSRGIELFTQQDLM